MNRLLIRNARIATPDGEIAAGDVLCENGVIANIGPQRAQADTTIDAKGLLLLPGVIDPHVHFREPGKEYKEDLGSGSRAAARGGVTSFLEMPNTEPATTTRALLQDKLARAAQKCVVNYGFFIGATPDNVAELNAADAACGIKIFMGCSTGNLLVHKDEDLERIFAVGDSLIAVHAEDEARIHARKAQFADRTDAAAHSEIRDAECARIAVARALDFARKYNRRLHILHASTAAEMDLLRREKTPRVRVEVIPNHLFLNTADYAHQGGHVQMNPPIRTAADNAALWQALHDGLIDFIGTDHAPHTLKEKDLPFPQTPSGMPGVETSLALMYTALTEGRLDLAQLQRWMCSGPAEAYGIAGKGKILEGWDADLVLIDTETAQPVRNDTLFTKAKWSPYAGRSLRGWPQYTIVNGEVVYARGVIHEHVRGRALEFQA